MNSHIDRMPADVKRKMALDHFSVTDIASFASAVRSNAIAFFDNTKGHVVDFWRKLLMRDFHFDVQLFDDPKSIYRGLVLERRRIMAYAQAMQACDAEREQMTPLEILRSLRDLPQNDPMLPLVTLLKFRQHTLFLKGATDLLSKVDEKVLQERNASLQQVYALLFAGTGGTTVTSLSEIMPEIKNGFTRQVKVDFASLAGMMMLMLSALIKCDAPFTLRLLLAKLDVDPKIKRKFLKRCGNGLSRDAVMFGRPEMLHALLIEFEKEEELGVCADDPAVYSEFFNETELLPLAAALKSMRDVCISAQLHSLTLQQRELFLRNYNSVIFLLCHYGAVPHRCRLEYSTGFMNNGVSLNCTIYDFVNQILQQLTVINHILSDNERAIVHGALQVVLDIKQVERVVEQENRDDMECSYDDEISPRKQARAEDELVEEFVSPKKKGKLDADDDGIVFTASPQKENGSPHDEEDEQDLSPVRRSLGRMGFGK